MELFSWYRHLSVFRNWSCSHLTLNQTVSTLRFFFRVTLRRHDIVEHTHFIHEPRKLPVVLSVEEVERLLAAAPGA